MDGNSTSEVETVYLEYPACRIPCLACDGVVDDGGPDEHEDDAGKHAASLCGCANCECGSVSRQPRVQETFKRARTYVIAANMP